MRRIPPPDSSRLLAGTAGSLLESSREDVRRAREAAARLGAMPEPRAREEALEAFDEACGLLADAGARASLARNVHPDPALRQAAEPAEQEGCCASATASASAAG